MSYSMKEQYTKGAGGSRKVNPKAKKGGTIKAGASNPPTQKRTPSGKKAK